MDLLQPRSRRGHTLVELATLLLLLSLAAPPLLSGVRRLLDVMAVVGAREELAGLLSRARTEGVLRGDAVVLVSERPPRAVLMREGLPLRATPDLSLEYGVRLDVGTRRGVAALRFGPAGLGVLASRTLEVARGDARARLVLSAHGRARRR